MERNFGDLQANRWAAGTLACVGLDSDYRKLPRPFRNKDPEEAVGRFNVAIIDATHDLVGTLKPQLSFYLALGDAGWRALRETVAYCNAVAPLVPVVLDAKWADIDNTNLGYVEAAFDDLKVDAVTLHPYLGRRALSPFLRRADKGFFVLCRTSNEGADEFQNIICDDGEPLFMRVARQVENEWNDCLNCGLVVGATYPDDLEKIRRTVGLPILAPGFGSQGADVSKAVPAGIDVTGQGMICSASRSIIFASGEEFSADAVRAATLGFRDEINLARGESVKM